ncbi:hypothetical protein JCM3766R1_001688 [Sporobolomyces carnicolor]
MTSRIMMRSVSAPAATDPTPPPVVAATLNETAFKPSTTRRDLSTSYRAFKQAWSAIEQVQVSSAACRRVGERAAEVLTAVREQLLQVEQRELERQRGKVVLERSYEFQQGQGSTGGSEVTIFKIQAVMLDIQAFATDHLAKSNASSRLNLLVDHLTDTESALAKLSSALATCIATYSLPSSAVSTLLWSDQDRSDLEKDHAALPRLFQLSISLKGPTFDRFTTERDPAPPPNETPGQRRAAFVAWCLEQNPILRPGTRTGQSAEGGGGRGALLSPPPSTQSDTRLPLKIPSSTLGLGLPGALRSGPGGGAGGVSMRRAATQPLAFGANRSSSESTTTRIASDDHEAPSGPVALPVKAVASTSDGPHSRATPLYVSAPTETAAAETKAVTESVDSSTALDATPAALTRPADLVAETGLEPSSRASTERESERESLEVDQTPSTVSNTAVTPPRAIRSSEADETVLAVPPLSKVEQEVVEPVDPARERAIDRVDEVEWSPTATMANERAEATTQEGDGLKESSEPASPDLEIEPVVSRVSPLAQEAAVHAVSTGSEKQSILGLALDTPLPLSPPVDGPPSFDSPRAPPPRLELLDALPIEDDGDKREPVPLPLVGDRALPSSPSLVVTSFDDDDDEEPVESRSPPPPPEEEALKPFRVLSLDGGGLVGPIAQLVALRDYLARHRDGRDDDEASSSVSEVVPSRHFDLVVGTSSSAIPALLVGQLGLSIEDALDVCRRVSRKVFGLDDGPSDRLFDDETKTPPPPRRVAGRWSRLFNFRSSSNRQDVSSSSSSSLIGARTVDRRTALELALKESIACATAPLPRSKTSCRAAVLAYERSPCRDPGTTPRATSERWLSVESNLSLVEIVQASIAFPPGSPSSSSSSSRFVPSPTSLNPTAGALEYVSRNADGDGAIVAAAARRRQRPVRVVSIAIGYELGSIPTSSSSRTTEPNRHEKKKKKKKQKLEEKGRTSAARLDALREVKQIGASNSIAHAHLLSRRIENDDDGLLSIERVEGRFDASRLATMDEVDLFEHRCKRLVVVEEERHGRGGTKTLNMTSSARQDGSGARSMLMRSPPGSPSSFKSQPPPSSPSSPSSSYSSSSRRFGGGRGNYFSPSSVSSTSISSFATRTTTTTRSRSNETDEKPKKKKENNGSRGGLGLDLYDSSNEEEEEEEAEEVLDPQAGWASARQKRLRPSISLGDFEYSS